MAYKYKRGQIFGKRLDVPKDILQKVYDRTLSFSEFINYGLDDKIPTSCIRNEDYNIVYDFEKGLLTFKDYIELGVADKISEKFLSNDELRIIDQFGLEKAKTLDWEIIYSNPILDNGKSTILTLMSISSSVEDVNAIFYEELIKLLPPIKYSSRMQEIYKDRYFKLDINTPSNDYINDLKHHYNVGLLSLEDIVRNWDLFKDMNLDYCLKTNKVKTEQVKAFMESDYAKLLPILNSYGETAFVVELFGKETSEEERKEYFTEFARKIINNVKNSEDKLFPHIYNSEWKEIFKYVPLEEIIKNSIYGRKVLEELKSLPEDYIYNIPFSISTLLESSQVLHFVGEFGIRNIVDFDNECGKFFSKDSDKMLKLMYSMYLNYANNLSDSWNPLSTATNEIRDENGKYLGRAFTKDDFYESMRRMIVYGPTDGDYQAPDYRHIVGEFREKNKDLFISLDAPQKLQDAFYAKNITPQMIRDLIKSSPDAIEFLKDKDLGLCFKRREVKIVEEPYLPYYQNLYMVILEKTDFESAMNFVAEYADVLDIVFEYKHSFYSNYEVKISKENTFEDIKTKISNTIVEMMLKEKVPYPKNIPQEIKDSFPTLFLDEKAPQELQDAFYNRTITPEFILSNKEYIQWLREIDLQLIYKYMPVKVRRGRLTNLVSAVENTFGKEEAFDVMLLYGKYFEKVKDLKQLAEFEYDEYFSKDDLLDKMDEYLVQVIINNGMKYDENMPSHLKNNYPTLFLNENIDKEIRDKFYNREFTLNDFSVNPDLFDMLGDTNIVCGFHEGLSWMIPLFDNYDDLNLANLHRLKVISEYIKIDDVQIRDSFREYILECGDSIDMNKIEYVAETLKRLSWSNSNEIFTFRRQLATQILRADNPMEVLDKVEDIFVKSNIPTVGKIYSCFEILHPDFEGFDFSSQRMSPVLRGSSTKAKKMTVFSDLIRTSFGSNNRSVKEYLHNIEIATSLYEKIKSGKIQYEMLNDTEIKELKKFNECLSTLYDNTLKGKKEENSFVSTGNVVDDIIELTKKLSPDGSLDYNVADRIVRMFCGFAGFNTLEQAQLYIKEKTKSADARNREAAKYDLVLEKGDFVKGIGGVTYLGNILQNGSVSKEFLGASADSDATPLDTDVSMILKEDGTNEQKIGGTAARDYGPIWFVLKNDDRFITTRDGNGDTFVEGKDLSKIDVFLTGHLGPDHYGIRTGFASSEINYIVMEEYDYRVGLEIAMNGFYIPVANNEGKIIFTPEDYDMLRQKMNGLSYFGENNFVCSKNLITEDTMVLAEEMERNYYETQAKRNKINGVIKEALDELGLQLKTTIDGDLTQGFVELIDTGSTGRGTNKPGDGDFDFMMRLDKDIISDFSILNQLKATIIKKLGKAEQNGVTDAGDFRLKGVSIDEETKVDIDITFAEKTDQVTYSTDMALQDRLATIKETHPEEYKYVLANILLAKQVLKEAECYKPNRGEVPQGGLGGVGVENWILQNGGSFVDAAKSFVDAAQGKSFAEFQSSYQIWDFGENHLASRRGGYSHDNFVTNNMSEQGYQKMVVALSEYLAKYNYENSGTKTM